MARSKNGKPAPTKAAPDQAFWFHHGPIVFDLEAFRHALQNQTSDEEFKYHITGKGRNDYAKWIRDVLMDDACAAQMERIRSRRSAIKIADECLKRYV